MTTVSVHQSHPIATTAPVAEPTAKLAPVAHTDAPRLPTGQSRRHSGPSAETARALIATWRLHEDASTRAQALELLVTGHLPLAHGLAHRYGHRGMDRDELEQVAALALVKAIHRYDLEASTPFGAFATPTITGELRRHFRDHGWLVRPPRPLQEQRQEMTRLREDLTARLGREPDELELSAALGVTLQVLRRIQMADRNLRPASLDAPASDTQVSLLELLQPREATGADVDEQLVVRDAVGSLPEVQQQLIHLRYTQELTQREVADVLHLTPMAVSRLQRVTLEALGQRLQALAPAAASA